MRGFELPRLGLARQTPEDVLVRENSMLKEENDFLKGLVARYEAELKIYQLKHPDLATSIAQHPESIQLSSAADVDLLPPWVLESRYMSPLLIAYESRIKELTDKNHEHMVCGNGCETSSLDFIHSLFYLFFADRSTVLASANRASVAAQR